MACIRWFGIAFVLTVAGCMEYSPVDDPAAPNTKTVVLLTRDTTVYVANVRESGDTLLRVAGRRIRGGSLTEPFEGVVSRDSVLYAGHETFSGGRTAYAGVWAVVLALYVIMLNRDGRLRRQRHHHLVPEE